VLWNGKAGYVLQNVRVWFKKVGYSKYISHLDLARCMARALKRADTPIWYTQGFNPRPFMTFALPLSLGVEGERESMDIRLTDHVDKNILKDRLNENLPQGIDILDITPVGMKASRVFYAKYEILMESETTEPKQMKNLIETFLNKKEILAEKKSKSKVKIINIKDYIKDYDIDVYNGLTMNVTLSSGQNSNLNPNLLVNAIKEYCIKDLYVKIKRFCLYDENLNQFI
jgi:radical SAM-linked protein